MAIAPAWLTEKPIAHRGLHAPDTERVENSVPAIKAAIDAGYALEVDVQQTADNKAVVFHDYSLERLTDRLGQCIDFTAEKLKTIEVVGSNSNIPTLKDFLELVDGRTPIFLEIKANRATKNMDAYCAAIAEDLSSYNGPIAVMSFHPLAIKYFADNAPNITRGMVLERYKKWWHLITGWRRARYCQMAKAQFVAHDVRTLPDRFTEMWRSKGGVLVTWTVRTPEDEAIAAKYADQPIFEYPAKPKI